MGVKEVIGIVLLVVRGVAWLVANVKLFVYAIKVIDWLHSKDEDADFIVWRVSGGIPSLAMIDRGFSREAALEDVMTGRLAGVQDFFTFGQRNDCVEWVQQWADTDERFIAVCTSNTDVIEDIGRRLEEEGV